MASHGNWRPPGAHRQRSVRFEASWEESREVVAADARRFDEICEAIQWQMENDAESCPELAGSPFRMARATDPDGALVRALFTIRADDQVSAWWVDRVVPTDDDDFS